MDKYTIKMVQKLVDDKEEELVKYQLAREFLRENKDLDGVRLMQGIDPTLGVEELEVKN